MKLLFLIAGIVIGVVVSAYLVWKAFSKMNW